MGKKSNEKNRGRSWINNPGRSNSTNPSAMSGSDYNAGEKSEERRRSGWQGTYKKTGRITVWRKDEGVVKD